ncbi:hypothetical protein [Clostridium sp. BSD9I1]|uniref:hypothetical protein n=1 Tax=Clostridium sp. BSD9I1 TaxID=2003589 RepID=UPI001645390E|nr:hypothetical protein [Clostridium sp. BSD9I1]
MNLILNKLTVFGAEEDVSEVMNFIKVEKSEQNPEIYGVGSIDFNKIAHKSQWRTKRNAINATDIGSSHNEIYFYTECTTAVMLIKSLSSTFSKVVFDYLYNSEELDTTIRIRIANGKLSEFELCED